jgi:steroid 5-alpha reductase family enzyme
MINFILYSALATFLYMAIIFTIAQIKKDNSIVDIAWGPGFILVSILTFLMSQKFMFRQILVLALVVLWGTRLALHITVRKRGRGEDFRYAQWRRDWRKWFFLRSLFQIFMLQGIMLMVIAYPIILINHSSRGGIIILDIIGALVWLTGFSFEAIGDYQLLKFKRHPENKGKIITQGLWKYTRHPNYFGETLIWWGIFLIALSVRNGWTAVLSPLLITFLLLRVSGITMLEKKYTGNKYFEEYARNTSPFIPWFPKKK